MLAENRFLVGWGGLSDMGKTIINTPVHALPIFCDVQVIKISSQSGSKSLQNQVTYRPPAVLPGAKTVRFAVWRLLYVIFEDGYTCTVLGARGCWRQADTEPLSFLRESAPAGASATGLWLDL